MSRLIIIPQFPTHLRYQEWWFKEFPKRFRPYFDDIIMIGKDKYEEMMYDDRYANEFAPMKQSIDFELAQIFQYLHMKLLPDDVLLLNDLSFPGLFAHALLHKRPNKCYAICHATSLNRYDYFAKNRKVKYPIEKSIAKLFNGIFVATEYHKQKLGWKNTYKVGLPDPPTHIQMQLETLKTILFISASRFGMQKRTRKIEKAIEKEFGEKIRTTQDCGTWNDYYSKLLNSVIMIVSSKEETYGYQIVDALHHGCLVVAPKKYSYPELLPSHCLYESIDDCIAIIHRFLDQLELIPNNKMQYEANHFYENVSIIMKL
jgi:hypothetical protein